MRVLGLIPARGGSKGVPRKNIKPLMGRPLIQYTIDCAKASAGIDRLLVSTDDEKIAEVSRSLGVEVPFLRPAVLASDASPTLPVIQHSLGWLEERGESFDAVCLLQPTNPLRTPAIIDGCLKLFEESAADSVITILPVPDKHNPHWVYFRSSDGELRLSTGEACPISRRQDLPPAFHREGSIYVTKLDVLMEGNSLFGDRVVGYPIDPADSVNIDSPDDWKIAERMIAERRTGD